MWIPDDPTAPRLITHQGKFPERLYRYRPLNKANIDRLIDFEIVDEAIYLAGLKDLNDPDEGRFRIVFRGTSSELIEYWRTALKSTRPEMSISDIEARAQANTDELLANGCQVPERVVTYTRHVFEHVLRVACFTTQPVNYLMWANYAPCVDEKIGSIGHGGVCIEYRCDESWRSAGLHPVEYTDAVPEINVVLRSEASLIKAMHTKAREWRAEAEWRVVQVLQAMPPFPEDLTLNSKIKLQNGVMSVIFGMNTPPELVSIIRSRVSTARPEIVFKQVVRDSMTFNRTLIELQ